MKICVHLSPGTRRHQSCYQLNHEQPVSYACDQWNHGKAKNDSTCFSLQRSRYCGSHQTFEYVCPISGNSQKSFKGRCWWLLAKTVEGHLGIGNALMDPCLAMLSASIASSATEPSSFFRRLSIHEIPEYQQKYLYLAAWALSEPNLSVVATANPSTFSEIVG